MGASTSTEQKVPMEQREAENLAASSGALPLLHKAFSKLADPHSNAIPIQSLQRCLCMTYNNPNCETSSVSDSFIGLLDHVGPSIVDLFFVAEKGGVRWVEFVKGYNKCCGRISSSVSLNILFRVFIIAAKKAGFPVNLDFEFEDDDCKINGSLLPKDVLVLLWMCWTMSWDFKVLKFSRGNTNLFLPDVSHLVLSAVTSCAEVGSGLDVWNCDISSLEIQLPVGKFLTWALQTLPSLPDCFMQFVYSRLQSSVAEEDKLESSSSSTPVISSPKARSSNLLTCGIAWAISLTIRSAVSEELLRTYFVIDAGEKDENLLYKSSLHGRGLNRFWSNIAGYQGASVILISATTRDTDEGSSNERKWIIGALTQQGFENKDMFYGSSGNLYSISPVFHVYSSTGKEKNCVYSHLHPTGRLYEPHPKPVGIAFGGTLGNERIFIDEDFARVTVRHHAVDKTYQHGSLFPDQGFLPVEALILEVEVWGLGGSRAKEVQDMYKKREDLFTEQRRRVDLKTFANWEDSPEKLMMDMVSDPNAVRREDR
ncbi:uncharacterized protein LOC107420375 [Ziziphus jujuba]|uniref:Uncharacterized protein LOC107420375 n=1 Tax=Ziziphus jujuba TaxID=326968 RepID=A0ABM3IPA4_ZIZJJ|nr:uncharacterized protein LOC107420375 [Ziziphus jujuba]